MFKAKIQRLHIPELCKGHNSGMFLNNIIEEKFVTINVAVSTICRWNTMANCECWRYIILEIHAC